MEARTLMNENRQRTIADEGYVNALKSKWSPMLEGVNNPYTRSVMSVLFENQADHIRQMIAEDTQSQDVGPFTKFLFPILRRVFPNLIANEIVSVQPMTAPVSAVFFYEYKYGTTKGGATSGNNLLEDFQRHYSSEFIDTEQVATGDGTNYGPAAAALSVNLQWSPVKPLDAGADVSMTLTTVAGAATVTLTDDGAGNLVGDGSGTINYATGAIVARFSAVPDAGEAIIASYYYDSENNTQIADVNIDISLEPIIARTRKLRARWSSEAADDLRAFHGLDAETELVAGISQEIALELDREILEHLLSLATTTTGTFNFTVPAGINEVDHIRNIITVLAEVSNEIHRRTLRAPANWIVTSPRVVARLSQLTTHGDFRPIVAPETAPVGAPGDYVQTPASYGPMTSHFGVIRVGTLANKWTVYQDPFFTEDRILLGLKGNSFLDAGYVYAPYVPLQVTPTFLDPNDFSFRKGLRTRYARKMLRPEFYGSVTVTFP